MTPSSPGSNGSAARSDWTRTPRWCSASSTSTKLVTPTPAEVAFRELAQEGDAAEVVEPGAVLVGPGGEVLGAHLAVDDALIAELGALLRPIKYPRSHRSAGMLARCMIFGFQPRAVLRKDFCGISAMARTYPEAHARLCELSVDASALLSAARPDVYERQMERVGEIRPEWRIPGSAFTTGVVNQTTAIPYHRDQGNFPDAWNVQIAWTREAEGGRLVVPELGVAFDYSRPAVTAFEAARYWHGVTPIRRRVGGYRFSVVWYAMRGLCACASPAEEVARIRRVRTERERRRRGRPNEA